jgi:hypothetical protein
MPAAAAPIRAAPVQSNSLRFIVTERDVWLISLQWLDRHSFNDGLSPAWNSPQHTLSADRVPTEVNADFN